MTKKNIWVVALLLALTFVFFSCGEEFDYNVKETFYAGPAFDWDDVKEFGKGLQPSSIFGGGTVMSWDKDNEVIQVNGSGGSFGFVFEFDDLDLAWDTTKTVKITYLCLVEDGAAKLVLKKADLGNAGWPIAGDSTPATYPDLEQTEIPLSFDFPLERVGDGDEAIVFQWNSWNNPESTVGIKILKIELE